MSSSWRMDPLIQDDCCLYKKRKFGDSHRTGRPPGREGGRDQGGVAISKEHQRWPAATRSQGEAWKRFLEPLEGTHPANTPISHPASSTWRTDISVSWASVKWEHGRFSVPWFPLLETGTIGFLVLVCHGLRGSKYEDVARYLSFYCKPNLSRKNQDHDCHLLFENVREAVPKKSALRQNVSRLKSMSMNVNCIHVTIKAQWLSKHVRISSHSPTHKWLRRAPTTPSRVSWYIVWLQTLWFLLTLPGIVVEHWDFSFSPLLFTMSLATLPTPRGVSQDVGLPVFTLGESHDNWDKLVNLIGEVWPPNSHDEVLTFSAQEQGLCWWQGCCRCH